MNSPSKKLLLALALATALPSLAVTKARYLDLMELAVGAYTPEHMERYLKDIQTKGIEEHGFPRLTSNLGVLLATGRRTSAHDKALFKTMMDECCRQMATAKARKRPLPSSWMAPV